MRDVRIKYNHWLPRLISKFFPILAITLGKTIYVTADKLHHKTWIHEFHHLDQMEEYGTVWFYLSYLCYYFAGLFKYRNHNAAYMNIPYEIDARRVEAGLTPFDVRLVPYTHEVQKLSRVRSLEGSDPSTDH